MTVIKAAITSPGAGPIKLFRISFEESAVGSLDICIWCAGPPSTPAETLREVLGLRTVKMNARYRLTGELPAGGERTASLHLLVHPYDESWENDGWAARLPASAYDELVASHPLLRAVDGALFDEVGKARKLELDHCVVLANLLPGGNEAGDVAEPAFVEGLAEALRIYGFVTELHDPRLHGEIVSSEARYIEVAVRQAGYDFNLLGGFVRGSTYFVFASNRIDRQSAEAAVTRSIAGDD